MKKYWLGIVICSLLILTTGCKKSIIGKWKSFNPNDEVYYTFNKDKTCSYQMTVAKLDCTYEIDDEKIIILYKGKDKPNTYQYRFEGSTLIIQDSNGRDNKFSK